MIFTYFFGVPYIRRFFAAKTFFLESTIATGGMAVPAVTFCPSPVGWMEGSTTAAAKVLQNNEGVSFFCLGLKGEDIVECIENKTLSRY